MVDVVDTGTRSRMMAAIKGKDTKPELALRRALHACGLRYRLHSAKLPGRPDIVLPRHRVVVFVHGCFWHRHEGCRFASDPATRQDFWQAKFAANVARDQRNRAELEAASWRVATVWECSIRRLGAPSVAGLLVDWLERDDLLTEI